MEYKWNGNGKTENFRILKLLYKIFINPKIIQIQDPHKFPF